MSSRKISKQDRFQFVERTAGMSETATGDHRHITAAGRYHWPQHQRRHVPYAAGRMLIDNRAIEIQAFPVKDSTGIPHRHGQRNTLRHGHIVEEDGHRQGGNLPFRDSIVTNTIDKETNFFVTQRMTITLFTNNFLCEKHGTLLRKE